MASISIKDNKAEWDKFIRGLQSISNGVKSVVTGVQEGTNTPEGISVASYAAINEFGATIKPRSGSIRQIRSRRNHKLVKHSKAMNSKASWAYYANDYDFETKGHTIPSRPFMRLYFDNNLDKINRFSENALTQVMMGRTNPRQAFTAIGLYTQAGLRTQIKKSSDYVPNSPSTISAKKSSKPLIEHGILLNNINFELRRE